MEFYIIKWELTGLNSILWLWNRIPQYVAKVNGKFVSFQSILFTRVEFTDKQFWLQSLQQISFNEQNLFVNKICYLKNIDRSYLHVSIQHAVFQTGLFCYGRKLQL